MIELMARRFGRFIVALLFLSSPLSVLAQNNSLPSASAKGESCFDYYKFQSVEIDLHGEKQMYKAGEGAKFIGFLTNKNKYPLVAGSLVLRISKLDPRSQVGNDIIDEWTAKDNINLMAGERQFVSQAYQLPSGLPTGTYTLTSYFLTQNKFNISGLSFTDDIYGGYATFTVEGQSERAIKFDRDGVKVDGKSYRIFGFLPQVFDAGTKKLSVSAPLKNDNAKAVSADVNYSLYNWDGIDKSNLIKTWSEKVDLQKQSSKILLFGIDVSERPVYFVKIVAKAGDQQSEIHLRFVKNGFRPRLNDVGITKFPLIQGEQATFFACYHNTTELTASSPSQSADPNADINVPYDPDFLPPPPSRDGKLELQLKDYRGNVLTGATYAGAISGNIDVFTKALSKRNLDKLILSAKLYDDNNNLVDEVNIPYDCSKFSEPICFKSKVNFYFLGGGVILIIIALYFLRGRFKKEETSTI